MRRVVRLLLAVALVAALSGCGGEAAQACDEAEVVADRAQLELEELEDEHQAADPNEHERIETAQLRAVERWAVTVEAQPECFSDEARASSEQLLETIDHNGDRTLD